MLPNVANVNRTVTIEVNVSSINGRESFVVKSANEPIDATYSRCCELQFGGNSRCVIIVFMSRNNCAFDDNQS